VTARARPVVAVVLAAAAGAALAWATLEALGLAPHAAAIQARFRDGWGVDDAFERPLRRVTPWGGKSTRRAA